MLRDDSFKFEFVEEKKIDIMVAVLGCRASGKTALINRQAKGQFSENAGFHHTNNTNTRNCTWATVAVLGREIKLIIREIFDDNFQDMDSKNIFDYGLQPKQHGAVLMVFDLSSEDSIKEIHANLDQLISTYHDHPDFNPNQLIIVGNKADIVVDQNAAGAVQQALQNFKQFLKDLEKQSIYLEYMETSAKTAENVNDLFEKAVKIALVNSGNLTLTRKTRPTKRKPYSGASGSLFSSSDNIDKNTETSSKGISSSATTTTTTTTTKKRESHSPTRR